MSRPLFVFGLDAGDPEFIRRWADEGHLPTLASIMARGFWARTGGAELLSEHGAWLSILSGVPRARHGYHYFRQLRPGTYELETVTGPDLDVPPFWTYGAEGDERVLVVDAPDTGIVDGLEGLQLAHWATHDSWDPDHFEPASDPPELLEELAGRFPRRFPVEEDLDSDPRNDRRIRRRLLDRVATKGELCRHLLRKGPFDLGVVVFAASHAASHQFWRYLPEVPEPPGADDVELRHAVRDVYRAIDREIGRLIEELPPETNIAVVSSVGMEDDFPTTGLIGAALREFGYQATPSSGPRSLHPLDVARRVVPESWRVALSRWLPRARRERLLSEAFRRGTDWSRTTAFATPTAYTSFVRVNLKGREPAGVVEPGREYRELLDRLQEDLGRLVDPVTDEPAVARSIRAIDAFGDDRHHALPDLFVEWKPGRYMDRLVYPGGEIRQERPDFFRRSDHSARGFVAAAGSDVETAGGVGEIDVLDLAPTFLALRGRRPPRVMSGSVLRVAGSGAEESSRRPLPERHG